MHGRVLVADLAGLDELAQGVGDLLHRACRGRRAGSVAGHHQHRVEGAGQAGTGVGGAVDQRVAGQLQAAVQRARLLTADDAADSAARPVDLLGRRPHLHLEDAVGDLAGQHEAERQDDGQRQPDRQSDDAQLQRAPPGETHRST